MTEIIITRYTTERLPSSYHGNPRYKLISEDGDILGATRVDDNIAYGPIPNHEGKLCKIEIHVTKGGRRYITSVTPE